VQRLEEAAPAHRAGSLRPRAGRFGLARAGRSAAPAGRVRAILGKIFYWLAVLALSLALLVGLVLFFESRDQSTLDMGAAGAVATLA
jgi:hypothetical protein